MRAAYLGPPGTVSDEALTAAAPDAEGVPLASLREVVLSVQEGRFERAISLCRRAIDKDGRRQSDLYLNLGKVLAMSRRRGEAIEALTEGLAVHPRDQRLRSELRHLVPRARPIFRSLPRRHPLNKYIGIARTVSARLWVTFIPQVRRHGRS